jgi:Histidine phosphatase superfamily (branch 1)
LGRRRSGDQITAVFSSDLARAAETASVAFAGTVIPVLHDWRLRECDYGQRNGMPAAELHAGQREHLDQPYPGVGKAGGRPSPAGLRNTGVVAPVRCAVRPGGSRRTRRGGPGGLCQTGCRAVAAGDGYRTVQSGAAWGLLAGLSGTRVARLALTAACHRAEDDLGPDP